MERERETRRERERERGESRHNHVLHAPSPEPLSDSVTRGIISISADFRTRQILHQLRNLLGEGGGGDSAFLSF